jgi:MurE/MurF fusion protein
MDQYLQAASGLSHDTRTLVSGDMYLAYVTDLCDRRLFLSDAVDKGASAILYQVAHESDPLPPCAVPIVPVVDLDKQVGAIADRFYQFPSKALTVIGITGTNGKSSIAYYLLQALTLLGVPTAMIGTLGFGDLDTMHASANTTPGVVDQHRLLARFRDDGKKVVVMEVSSHALDQGRVDHVAIDIAVFTNLTRDHLDYHGSMSAYGKSKERLFTHPGLAKAVINVDDLFGQELFARYKHAMDIKPVSMNDDVVIDSPLIGGFNRLNLLCVAAVLRHMDIDAEKIAALLPKLQPAPGRMQLFSKPGFAKAVVDYAHTPDALAKALQALRPLCHGALWCVIGCGGDRDEGKRGPMARIAEQYADQVILTDDNPRFEDPTKITDAMQEGMRHPNKAIVEHARVRAIAYALETAGIDDVVLVAGKGHESYQLIGDKKIHCDDRDSVQDIMSAPVSIDTRTLNPGDVYVAIRGVHADGHDFLNAAMSKGAAYALVEEKKGDIDLKQCLVPDTTKALGALAKQHRMAMSHITMIALTGSCGKTTTRQFIQSICEQVYKTHASIKSFNNHLGVPLTLLGIKPSHDMVVQEMGANHAGELSYLTQLVQPDVAMITNIAPVHLEGFGSLEGVARAKSEIFEGLGVHGTAVLNADDAFFETLKTHVGDKRIVTFSMQHTADVMAENSALNNNACASFDLVFGDKRYPVSLQMLGAHNVANALAAAACAYAVGIDAAKIVTGLQEAQAVERRMRVVNAVGGARLIDDSYNANPSAVMAAIDVLVQFEGLRILVLGDMGELGADATLYHAKVGAYARDHQVDQLYCVGDLTRYAVDAYGETARFFEDKTALIAHLKTSMDATTTLLVKGSLSMAMDEITRGVRVQ